MRTKTIPPVRLDFRNEAYGFVYRPAAFRFGYMGDFSQTRRNKIQAKVRSLGFAYSHLRESWIKEDVDNPAAEAQNLVTALTTAGFVVETNQFYPNLAARHEAAADRAAPQSASPKTVSVHGLR